MPSHTPTPPPHAFTASWVWCQRGDLRRGAAVVMEGGRIREVADRPPAGLAVTDLGEGLLLPGLVNAHTHLELSFLAGAVPPRGDFVGWLEDLVAARPGHDHPGRPQAPGRRSALLHARG
ncbi:MAG: hypothetical protein HY794_06330 [Desulfarculus sp.]|nr:hypothetical protein [Desulfarculus sp.]